MAEPTRRRSRHSGFLALGLILALVLAACGGSGDTAAEGDDEGNGAEETEGGEEAGGDDETGDETPFYEGKSIEMVVPASPGGGTDIVARLLAPFLQKHIAGNPSIQVVNVPGGAGVVGANQFALAMESDGTNVFLSSGSPHLPYLLRDPTVEFDLRDFEPTLGTSAGAVIYVSPETGIETPADLANPDTQLRMAGQLATGSDATFLVAWELLDLDVEVVFGYEGKGPIRVAFEQGEANIDWQASPAYTQNVQPLVDAGDAIPIMTAGQVQNGELVRDPSFPDLPTVGEVYEEIHGESPSGEAWEAYKALVSAGWSLQKVLWFHGDAPPEAIEAVREAAQAMADDPEFVEERKAVLGEYPLVVAPDLQPGVKSLVETPDDVIDWTLEFLVSNYDVDR